MRRRTIRLALLVTSGSLALFACEREKDKKKEEWTIVGNDKLSKSDDESYDYDEADAQSDLRLAL